LDAVATGKGSREFGLISENQVMIKKSELVERYQTQGGMPSARKRSLMLDKLETIKEAPISRHYTDNAKNTRGPAGTSLSRPTSQRTSAKSKSSLLHKSSSSVTAKLPTN